MKEKRSKACISKIVSYMRFHVNRTLRTRLQLWHANTIRHSLKEVQPQSVRSDGLVVQGASGHTEAEMRLKEELAKLRLLPTRTMDCHCKPELYLMC